MQSHVCALYEKLTSTQEQNAALACPTANDQADGYAYTVQHKY